MAYKSPVTNKYMGSTYAGRVNPGRENELTQLARSLGEFSEAVPRGIAAFKDKKIDEAEKRLEELKVTMSTEELNNYILSGQDSILANKWAVSVVDGQLGRFDAAEAIRSITANGDNYNFETGNRREFYKQFLPDFASKSSSYKNGFGVHFNDWQSRDLLEDATRKAQFRQDSKIRRGVTFLSTAEYETMDEFYAIAQSLNSELPQTDGEKNFFFTNEDINNTIVRLAEFTLQNADSQDDFDRAMSYLTGDRGTSANGTKLGSLKDTAREDVSALIDRIDREKNQFISHNYRQEQYEEEQRVKEFSLAALADIGTANEYKTFKANRDEIAKFNPAAAQALDKLYMVERDIDVDPNVISNFDDKVLYGAYQGNFYQMVDDMRLQGIPFAYLEKFARTYEIAEEQRLKGSGFVFNNNEAYTTSKSLIIQKMQPNFEAPAQMIGGRPVRDTSAYNAASAAATQYMNRQILLFEAQERDRPLTDTDRLDYMEALGKQVLQMFKLEQGLDMNQVFSEPPEMGVTTNPDFREVSQELFENRSTLGNIVEGAVEAGRDMMAGISAEVEPTQFTNQQIADRILSTVPAYLSNNLPLFVQSLRRIDVERLQDAYGLSDKDVMEVLRLINETNG
tara:strand:- start:4401 stop:6272 length:1872 start_codon:yes stop_codon:yes gene_type:complete